MKKRFDAVRWMRQRRAQIDDEDRSLTWAEKRRKTHEIIMRDPLLARLCTRVFTAEQACPVLVKESSPVYGPNARHPLAVRAKRK